jgi:hypothetical protein
MRLARPLAIVEAHDAVRARFGVVVILALPERPGSFAAQVLTGILVALESPLKVPSNSCPRSTLWESGLHHSSERIRLRPLVTLNGCSVAIELRVSMLIAYRPSRTDRKKSLAKERKVQVDALLAEIARPEAAMRADDVNGVLGPQQAFALK